MRSTLFIINNLELVSGPIFGLFPRKTSTREPLSEETISPSVALFSDRLESSGTFGTAPGPTMAVIQLVRIEADMVVVSSAVVHRIVSSITKEQ